MSRVELTDDGIKHVLAGEGYEVRRIAELTYRGQLRAGHRTLTFHIHVDPAGYVTCAVIPFLRSPEDAALAHRLYQRMMALNQQLMMAKLSIDDDLDVVLSVEYPSATLDDSELADAIRVLAYYADQHIDELTEIAEGGSPEPRASMPPPMRAVAPSTAQDAGDA